MSDLFRYCSWKPNIIMIFRREVIENKALFYDNCLYPNTFERVECISFCRNVCNNGIERKEDFVAFLLRKTPLCDGIRKMNADSLFKFADVVVLIEKGDKVSYIKDRERYPLESDPKSARQIFCADLNMIMKGSAINTRP